MISLLYLALVGSASAKTSSTDMLGQELPEPRTIGVLRSYCVFGLYIDDAGPGLGNWDTSLYLSNIHPTLAANFDVYVSFIDVSGVPQFTSRSFILAPNQLRILSCLDLASCDTNGWLYIQSDTSLIGATVLLIQPTIAGAITAQPPTGCVFNIQ